MFLSSLAVSQINIVLSSDVTKNVQSDDTIILLILFECNDKSATRVKLEQLL
jgi:hypothetical protein